MDKAGGRKAQHPLVLHVLNTRSSDEVQPFVDRVAALSGGRLRVSVSPKWHRGSPTVEADAIRAVQAGKADFAVDAARAWHEVGVTSFDALVAPLAVDSMALQEKVLGGSLPGRMLTGPKRLGLAGIGILPGVMRRPAGITRALLAPADVHRLSEQQLGWLRAAAGQSVHATTLAHLGGESEERANMCRRGKVDFVDASPAQLAQLRSAFQPVYAWLGKNEQTKHFLAEIADLRSAGVGPYPQETLRCPAASPGAGAAVRHRTPFDGTYRLVTTRQDDLASESVPVPENWGNWIFVFDRGRFAITQQNAAACTWGYGTYTVTGQHVEWLFTDGGGIAPSGAVNKPGEDFVFRWSRYRDAMSLSAVAGAISPANFFGHPWQLLSSTAAPRYFSTRCPPPETALAG